MRFSDTHFQNPAVKQSILYLNGQLDSLRVASLQKQLRALAISSGTVIPINMQAVDPVLTEGIVAIRALAELDWSGPALALEFYDFNDQAARAFQINGLLLQNKTFRLHLVARPDPEPLYSSYLMDCPACHSRLRIQSRGYHACPRCGHHFPTSASKPGSDLCAYN
ncbi:MAG: hypothetical protein KDK39_12770 [Leptospiraceae bacterium]|nr:hypothetical protein [Leptospiraceae bacterium]